MDRTNANRRLWTALRAHDAPGAIAALEAGANPRVQSGRRLPLAHAMEHAALMEVAACLVTRDPKGSTDLVCQMMRDHDHSLVAAREKVLVAAHAAGADRRQLFRAAIMGAREDWVSRLFSADLVDMDRAGRKPMLCEWGWGAPPGWLCAAFLDAPNSCLEAERELVVFALVLSGILPAGENTLAQQMCARPGWLGRGGGDNGSRLLGGALANGQMELAAATLQAMPAAPDRRRQGWLLGKFMQRPTHAMDEQLRCGFVAKGFVATTSTIRRDEGNVSQEEDVDALLLALSWNLPPNTTAAQARQQLDGDIANIQWHHARGGNLAADFDFGIGGFPADHGLVRALLLRYASWPALQGQALSWLASAQPDLLSSPRVALSIASTIRDPKGLLPLLARVPSCASLAGIPILEAVWRRCSDLPLDPGRARLTQLCVTLVRDYGVDPFQVHDGKAFMLLALPPDMREQLAGADAARLNALLESQTKTTNAVRPLRRL